MVIRYWYLLLLCICLPSCAFQPAIDKDGVIHEQPTTKVLKNYGLRAFKKFKAGKAISKNPQYNKQVERVSERLKKAINIPETEWEFVVFKDRSPNAFALPGGKVGIFSGLFHLISDPDQERSDALLAAVLGHEISHATVKHAEKRMYRAITTALIGGALWYGLEQKTSESPERSLAAYTLGSYIADSLPLSRFQEYESDKIGAIYMAKAGYDPRESLELWHRLSKHHVKFKKSIPNLLRTHPPDETRIIRLEKFMPIATQVYKNHQE